MARGPTKSLYLEITGGVGGLKAATSAGKTVLNDFGGAAINVLEEVEKEMAKLGSAGLPNLKTVETAYDATFKRIAANARAVIDAPTPQAAVQIIDGAGARQAAETATANAAALRLTAEAATRADLALGGTDKAQRAYAASAATAALAAESEAQALRDQAAVLARVEGQLGINAGALKRNVAINGQARAGYQQLSYQLGDVATQFAAGTPATIIFGQQIGQVSQAISMVAGNASGFARFLGGPWLIAGSAAATVLVPWVAKLLEGDHALKDEIESLRKSAASTEMNREAKEAFLKTTDGVTAGIREQIAATEKLIAVQRTSAETANIGAKQAVENGRRRRTAVAASLADARERLDVQVQRASGSGQGAEVAAGGIARVRAEVRGLEAELAALDESIAAGTKAVERSRLALAAERAKDVGDATKQTDKRFDAEKAALDRRLNLEIAGGAKIGAATQRLYDDIERRRAAAHKTEEDRQAAARKKPPSLGAQVSAERSGDLLASAERYRGLSERGDNAALQSLFKEAGKPVDPKITAWCAAFVNAVLATNGLPGTGSLSARSFLGYGEKTNSPVKGDIVVSRRGTGQQGHVGFFQGTDKNGNVLVLGGNTGDKVGTQTVARGDVLGFRRAATKGVDPDIAARKAEIEADRRTQNADAYASLLGQTQDQQLRIERTRVTSISELAELDIAAVAAARADIDRAAQKGVELEKWTQAEADGVKAIAAGNAVLEAIAIREREALALADEKFEIEQADLNDKVSLLQLQGDLASTAADRRAIARQLLQLEQQQVADLLRDRIAKEQDPERRAQLERRQAQLPIEFELKRQAQERQNQDPVERYRQKLKDSAGDMAETYKTIAADGLQSLEDGFVGIISGTESVGSAFKRMADQIIADIARIAVQRLILGAFDNGLSGLFGGSAGGASGIVEGDGSIFNPEWFRKMPRIPGLATGGRISGAGTGTSDSILALVDGQRPIRVSNGEGIVNAEAVRRYWPLIDAMNKGRLPQFADGGLVAPMNFIPRLPSIDGARRAMAAPAAPAVTIPMSIDARGADTAAVARLEAALAQLKRDLPGQIVATYQDAKTRRVIQ